MSPRKCIHIFSKSYLGTLRRARLWNRTQPLCITLHFSKYCIIGVRRLLSGRFDTGSFLQFGRYAIG
jgi:hypothetical protein